MSTLATLSPVALARQIARLTPLDTDMLGRVCHEVLTVPSRWVAGYGEYQSGGWWTLSLYNHNGDAADVTIRDGVAVETALLRLMPATRAFLRDLGLTYMWVRIAKLCANSFLWEHRDYAELSDRERSRLHIPLVTNSSAFVVTGGARVHLSPGHVWQLLPTHPHGACNLLGPARLHLILDCYPNKAFEELAGRPALAESDVTWLSGIPQDDIDASVEKASRLARLGYPRTAERSLLRLFFNRALPDGCAYDLVVRMYESIGCADQAAEWTAKKEVMLGGR